MIRTQEMVPDYYIEKSRDFQVLCRTFDYDFNAVKYNINTMQYLTDTRKIKDTALPLLGDKLGIRDKEAAGNRELLESLPVALKYKGSLKSVNILINAFLDSMRIFDYAAAFHSKDDRDAERLSQEMGISVDSYSIVIVLSTFPSLANLDIFNEYLKMVIPTGMSVRFLFGLTKKEFDRFIYDESIFVLYTNMPYEQQQYPINSSIRSSVDRYAYIDADEEEVESDEADFVINTVGVTSVKPSQYPESESDLEE